MVSIHAPVKVRLYLGKHLITSNSFNSRTCEGATVPDMVDYHIERVSIHAPVKVRRRKGICVES